MNTGPVGFAAPVVFGLAVGTTFVDGPALVGGASCACPYLACVRAHVWSVTLSIRRGAPFSKTAARFDMVISLRSGNSLVVVGAPSYLRNESFAGGDPIRDCSQDTLLLEPKS